MIYRRPSALGVLALGLLCRVPLLAVDAPLAQVALDHPVFRSILTGDITLLKSLVREGNPVRLVTETGVTPLMIAALHGTPEAVALLLENGADPLVADAAGATALIYSAGDEQKVERLLKHGADPDIVTRHGNTALIVAAAYPNPVRVLNLLLRHGANVHARNNRGHSALTRAIGVGDRDAVSLLFDRGAALDGSGFARTALVLAAETGNAELVQDLLAQGVDPNAADGFVGHALNAALLYQHADAAAVLLRSGSRLDLPSPIGKVPPLVFSSYVENKNVAAVEWLLAHGADATAANADGETALTWARRRGFPKLIRMLEDAGTPDFGEKEIRSPDRGPISDARRPTMIREAISGSVALLQAASDQFLEKRDRCVSCHHQNLPAVALSWARERGFSVNDESLRRMDERQVESWGRRMARVYEMDDPVPVPPRFLGYGFLGFAALNHPPDDLTRTMSWYLGATQRNDGHWPAEMARPPMGGGAVLGTVLAMRSLQLYPPDGRFDRWRERVQLARVWLLKQRPEQHQERVFQLLGLTWAESEPTELGVLSEVLLGQQRADGGWSQFPNLASDAWATGQTLVALRLAGALSTADPAYRRGLDFLLRNQFEDGSWFVHSRSWPFQAYFESGFPHGKDQWVSAPATAWAIMAMTLAL